MPRTPIYRSWRARAGYSLIEVMVAAAILAVGLTGVASAFSFAARTSRLSGDTIVAQNLASALLADLRSQSYSQLASWYTYPGESGTTGLEQSFGARLVQAGLPSLQTWVTVTDVQTDVKGVTVVIEWGTGNPRGRVEMSTLVSPRY